MLKKMSLGARNFKVWKTVGRMQERRAFHAVSVNKVDTYTGPTVTFYRLEDVESRVGRTQKTVIDKLCSASVPSAQYQ